jgi:gamma-glutamyl hercynylcysteine S-oxide synthase
MTLPIAFRSVAIRRFLFVAILLVICHCSTVRALAQNSEYKLTFTEEQINGPSSPADFPAWLAAMKAWRAKQLASVKYDGSDYQLPELQWEKSSFIQPQMMVEDRFFYDPTTRKYTVGRYLNDLKTQYGGIDSVLIWPTYPNMGIDDRNTDDMMRSMPGGVAGVRKVVAEFHGAGVRVLFPINPWDVGTRDPGAPWGVVLPHSMTEIGADGLNGDTMDAVTSDYMLTSLADHHPLALEPELGLRGGEVDQLAWNTMNWGYWQTEFFPPLVSTYKWLEPRLMVNVCDRWNTNKTGLIQSAFFNGAGIETWENVFGIWNGMTERDSEAVRRVATIERAFPDLLSSQDWEPFTPTVKHVVVFASKWPDASTGRTLWTLVNRGDSEVTGNQLCVPYTSATRFYDLWHGVEIQPRTKNGAATLRFSIEAHGYGAILADTRAIAPPALKTLLLRMRTLARRPLASFSTTANLLPQTITPIAKTAPARSAPPGMVYIPGGEFDFEVSGIEEEDNGPGVDFQYPWEREPVRQHSHTMNLAPFYIDTFPVTNAQFKAFLRATNYRPADAFDFLKDWTAGAYPAGWGARPVTWVSLEDARAYAAWAHKRLPHEWEWQFAAQGSGGRLYPWGNAWNPSKVPVPDTGRLLTAPSNVDTSSGESPFGVRDLVGNVWQWTDEYTDMHTRAAVLRGGSYYQPQGSGYYFPQAYRLDQHGKYLLMSPGRDRSGTIGFRCVKDTAKRTSDAGRA